MEVGQTIQKPKEKRTKLNIEQHKPHNIPGLRSGAPKGKPVPAPLVAAVVDLLLKSWKNTFTKRNKYIVNQNLEHIDDVNIRELVTII